MGKIISIDEINRAVMEGKDDLVFELCKVFDHESYFDPIFDPPESFLQECAAYWNRRSRFLPPMIWIPRSIPCRTALAQ